MAVFCPMLSRYCLNPSLDYVDFIFQIHGYLLQCLISHKFSIEVKYVCIRIPRGSR